ncbi:hypothetical protein, partial [Streptococcus pneumoniae]|uniref:hypothetical protein n=1 Tax=Streptococcus pneumoniae TaxID=1313 RepID=UPI00077BAF6F
SLFIIGHMGLFFYNKIGSIISIVDLPTIDIIEPFFCGDISFNVCYYIKQKSESKLESYAQIKSKFDNVNRVG